MKGKDRKSSANRLLRNSDNKSVKLSGSVSCTCLDILASRTFFLDISKYFLLRIASLISLSIPKEKKIGYPVKTSSKSFLASEKPES